MGFCYFYSMIGYIYLIIDTTNGKKYVGQHHYDKEELDPSYHGSGRIISKIYKKRPETIKEEYVKTCYTQRELDEWEKYFIFTNNTLYPNGYNLEEGGCGGVPCEETRKKMSESMKGRPSHNKGKPMSEEQKKKLSESHKGKTTWNKGVLNTKQSKIVLQYSLTGDFIMEYSSISEAVRSLGIDIGNSSHISRCCKDGKHKSAYGFKWKYKE